MHDFVPNFEEYWRVQLSTSAHSDLLRDYLILDGKIVDRIAHICIPTEYGHCYVVRQIALQFHFWHFLGSTLEGIGIAHGRRRIAGRRQLCGILPFS